MKQLNVDDWPRGLDATVAIVKLSLEELSLRLSLPVQDTYDGLGELFVCLFEVPSGRQYALTQRKGDLQRAEIVVNWFTDCILSDVEEILSLCSLSYSDVIWIREDADSYPWALMSQDSNGSIQILDVFAFKETADHLLLDYKILSKDKVWVEKSESKGRRKAVWVPVETIYPKWIVWRQTADGIRTKVKVTVFRHQAEKFVNSTQADDTTATYVIELSTT